MCPFSAPHMLCYIEDSQYETEKNKSKSEVTYLSLAIEQKELSWLPSFFFVFASCQYNINAQILYISQCNVKSLVQSQSHRQSSSKPYFCCCWSQIYDIHSASQRSHLLWCLIWIQGIDLLLPFWSMALYILKKKKKGYSWNWIFLQVFNLDSFLTEELHHTVSFYIVPEWKKWKNH